MILELASTTPSDVMRRVVADLEVDEGLTAWPIRLRGRLFVIVSGDESRVPDRVLNQPGVTWSSTSERGYWLVDAQHDVVGDTVTVGSSVVGGKSFWLGAGPCALERVDDAVATAAEVAAQDADAFRIGLWKPRTSPYNFQGRGAAAFDDLERVRAAAGLPIVSEVLDPRDVERAATSFDCLQIGTRNMTNQALLVEVGRTAKPVLLKRGLRSTIDEWLRAAEYVVAQGNDRVILCARGIASFDTSLRHQPDLSAILTVRRHSSLPVIFDPSHATGRLDAVARFALAAASAGADGLLVEAHVRPDEMYRPGDAAQAYPPTGLKALREKCRVVRDLTSELDAGVAAS